MVRHDPVVFDLFWPLQSILRSKKPLYWTLVSCAPTPSICVLRLVLHLDAEFSALLHVRLRVIGFDFGEGLWFHEALCQKARDVIRRQNVWNDDDGFSRVLLKLFQTEVGVEMAFYVPKKCNGE